MLGTLPVYLQHLGQLSTGRLESAKTATARRSGLGRVSEAALHQRYKDKDTCPEPRSSPWCDLGVRGPSQVQQVAWDM